MKSERIKELHTQNLTDIVGAISAHARFPENKVFEEMALSSRGSLFTRETEFHERVAAFIESGEKMGEIFIVVRAEIGERLGVEL